MKGLTSQKAKELLRLYGPNEIKHPKRFTFLRSFVSQFRSFLVLLLIAAAATSLLIGDNTDALFILFIVLLNALFGFYQEYKAEKALTALKNLAVTTVRVIRDGHEEELDNRYLVPGDVIYLEQGAKIPADSKLLESWHLEINEASLTGESFPVEKDHKDKSKRDVYLGTIISKGRCYAQVTKTGHSTRFGQIASTLSQIEEEKTPLQKKLEIFTKKIGLIGILASLIVFGFSFVQEKTLVERFIFAVSLAVAAVPEGLPAVMTITLAIGVERMAKKKVVVRKLNAIEALGSVTLLATDKTGTLTTNKMSVKKIWVENKVYDIFSPRLFNYNSFTNLVLNGILCSTASIIFKVDHGKFEVLGDPTEGAMLIFGQNLGLNPEIIKPEWKIIKDLPFNPNTKRMSVVVNKNKETYVFTKGAPESIISICNRMLVGENKLPLTQKEKVRIEKEFQNFAKKGLRIIAFSFKDSDINNIEKNHVFLGFAGIADPIRDESLYAVKKAHQAGIKVVMITGDSELTAEAIGIEAGIIKEGDYILNGIQIDKYSDKDLLSILPKVKIFARTSPENKYRIVQLFQNLGEIVAVMGDGVNDTLAIKKADVGVVMGLTGTDVAKETADIVIADDNFGTLVNAVEEGRNIISRIRNAIKFLLACNLGEVIYILIAVTFQLPLLIPLQILYMNLVTDGLPAISFAFSPRDLHIMQQRPRKIESVLNKDDYKYVVSVGILTALLVILSATNTTSAFTSIILIQHFILIDTWLSHKPLIKNITLLGNPIFLAAFLIPIVIHPLLLFNPFLNRTFGTNPLNLFQIVYSIGVSLTILIIIEVNKILKTAEGI
ncbi:hypothetical protein A2627_02585 [Candidatus Woesebacteria bacterium RIFCSPHIGHO2_01_FULL_39_28]|uniref:Cation-transporting P-type ATPase N-terminal domain-containing protein n=1 Tax=Candidatus Woesebacteria bacterium RIFCSPHIGHO2_01_FULL_39_28 TaxID=1802496 RepID=A0A1F7YBJ2_9BACT|nr:MAG: hypothetical protein A2627_02585 [Candidatus Woesebacteria bacterium RIFCSPHIGHO2_01_FULL_39_28]OGM58389.1 MAG: hypothetical protein A3A50_02510 [Candidatus Woesebacteria bacterium RIFCSPLOWO2_01_FULL_38_20]